MSSTVATLASRGLFSGLLAAVAPSAVQFRRALADPERAQKARLDAVLRAVAGTDQARRYGLEKVRTARELRSAVPIHTADALAPELERIARGERWVLTRAPVERFELSGGSTGASKPVPVTAALLSEFHAALAPWLFDLYSQRPALRRGPGYWSISPLVQQRVTTAGGIPVGSVEDSAYFPKVLQPLLARALAVPGSVAHLGDVDCCRYVSLWHLVAAEDLTLISVWNPSFLTLLMDALDRWAGRLAEDLEAGVCRPPGTDLPVRMGARAARASALRASLRGDGTVDARALWPSLSLISLWTHADAARMVRGVRARFPGVELQPKGLLATEGVVSFPLFDAPAPVLAIRSHFYEFVAESGDVVLAHQLEEGRTYDVLLSSSGGLLRYRLGDRVRVDGLVGRTPCLTFLGRSDAVSDLVGEKLAVDRVAKVLEQVVPAGARFAMLAPEWSAPPAYHLFVEGEGELGPLGAAVEDALCEGHAYRYARRLGQLGPVRAVRVRDAAARYEARCVALGQRAGNVKPVALHRTTGWREVFEGGMS